MTRRAGSVVATAARVIVTAAVTALLAACGQKGALVLAKPAPAAVPPAVPPSATTVVPAALPTSAPASR
ncbi:MAG: LPS translocon maturation chaperone LptM [Caldimonas sp.]